MFSFCDIFRDYLQLYEINLIYLIKKNTKMNRKDIIYQIKKRVKKVSPGTKIILYGSEARGESEPDSDIDVLILVDKESLSFKDKSEITEPIYDLELETGVPISPLIYTQKQWNNRPFKTPFYVNVMNEGILL